MQRPAKILTAQSSVKAVVAKVGQGIAMTTANALVMRVWSRIVAHLPTPDARLSVNLL